jgi:uncharacterized protein YaaW (UPF0174 family)
MKDILARADGADLEFVGGILSGRGGLMNRKGMKAALGALAAAPDDGAKKDAVVELLEREIRYAGSADVAYLVRRWRRGPGEAGRGAEDVVHDVARKLKVRLDPVGTLEQRMSRLVTKIVERELVKASPEEQRAVLARHGVGGPLREQIIDRLRRHGPLGAVPLLAALAGREVAAKIVTDVVLALVSKVIGREIARHLISRLVTRFPWWSQWIGPLGWVASAAWVAFDLQGPAYRKTVPIVLYLGLVALRTPADVAAAAAA